jgi:hypothetical protein
MINDVLNTFFALDSKIQYGICENYPSMNIHINLD